MEICGNVGDFTNYATSFTGYAQMQNDVSEGKFDQAVTVRSEVIKDAPRNLLSWLLEEDEASTPLLSASNRKDLQYSSISNDLLRSVSHLAQLSANMFQTNPLQIQCLVERDDRMTQIDCLNLNIQ